mgnify:CR=1 FL=1
MKTTITILIALILIGGGYFLTRGPEDVMPIDNPGTSPTPSEALIRVTTPVANAVVKSPLTVSGEARGNWYFEASFPVKILDANGNQLGIIPAQAQSEWMTTDFVPFSTSLVFSTSTTDTGTLVLEKDNPSGLPEHADEVRIPIRFR